MGQGQGPGPSHETVIDQPRGVWPGIGMQITEYGQVRDAYEDYGDEPWSTLSSADRAWWEDVLLRVHQQRVALESLAVDARARAYAHLEAAGDYAVEDLPDLIAAAVEAATA